MRNISVVLTIVVLLFSVFSPSLVKAQNNKGISFSDNLDTSFDVPSVEEVDDYTFTIFDEEEGETTIAFNDQYSEGVIYYEDDSESDFSIEVMEESVSVLIDGDVAAEIEGVNEQDSITPMVDGYEYIHTYTANVDATKKTAEIATIIISLIPGYAVPAAVIGAVQTLKPQKNAYVKVMLYYNQNARLNRQLKRIYSVYKKSNYTDRIKRTVVYNRPFQ